MLDDLGRRGSLLNEGKNVVLHHTPLKEKNYLIAQVGKQSSPLGRPRKNNEKKLNKNC
jgi:hypothetical protein